MASPSPLKMIVVTGAGGGQGSDVARRLASKGYGLGLIDLDEAAVRALHDELSAAGAACAWRAADISRRNDVEAALENFSRLAPIYGLLNTAALLKGGLLMEEDDAAFDRVFAVNVRGGYLCNVIAARHMIEAGRGGRIVNWSSASAHTGYLGYAAYGASKAAMEGLTRLLSLELAEHQITVNTIIPGSIQTPMVGYFTDADMKAVAEAIPLGRWGLPPDITEAALFLLSEQAAWITGASLAVDGGQLAGPHGANVAAARELLRKEREHAARKNQERIRT